MEIIKKILSLILRKIKKEKFLSLFAVFLILTLFTLKFFEDKILVEVPKNGGKINEIIIGQNPRFINPVLAMTETDKALISLIYSPLLKKNKDGNLIENIASYKLSEDFKTYTIKLKDNIYFHDGFKMSIDDVIFTIEQIQDPLNDSFYRPQWNNVKLKKIDNLTLELTLPKIDYYFKLALELYILPKHIWEKVDYFNLSSENLKPTGSGPFKIKEVKWDFDANDDVKNEKINALILEKNERYFKKQPYIESLAFNFFDSRSDYIAKKNNLGDYQNFYSYDKWDKKNNFKIHSIIEPVDFNLTIKNSNSNSFLKNEKIRKYIFDIWKSKNDDEVNLLKTELLKDENFKEDKENNLIKYKNKIISFSTILGNNEDNSLALLGENLKSKLRKSGIVLNLKILDEIDFWNKLRDRNFESIISGYQTYESSWYYYYHSSQRDDPGVNIAGFNSNKLDTLLLKLHQNLKAEDRKKIKEEFKKEIQSHYLVLNLEKQQSYYHLKNEIDYMQLETIPSGEKRFDTIQNWVVETEKILPIFKD